MSRAVDVEKRNAAAADEKKSEARQHRKSHFFIPCILGLFLVVT